MDATYTGNRIFSLRKQNNLTQKELAEKLHVTDKAISKWERGLNFPDLALFPVIANVLGTSVADLLGLEQNIPNSTIDVINEIAQSEKKQMLKTIHEYVELTIVLGVVIILNKLYISSTGYIWEIFNIQFWMEGILIGLALTLITNGIWLLKKYKRFSV